MSKISNALSLSKHPPTKIIYRNLLNRRTENYSKKNTNPQMRYLIKREKKERAEEIMTIKMYMKQIERVNHIHYRNGMRGSRAPHEGRRRCGGKVTRGDLKSQVISSIRSSSHNRQQNTSNPI